MKKKPENLIKMEIPPLFADEVIVVTPVKAVKHGKKVEKEGHVVLIFVDMLTQKAVARIVLSKNTAKSLKRVLSRVLTKLERDLKSERIPATKIELEEAKQNSRYIG